MSNCFLTGYDITDSIVVALSTHHYIHSVEYFELRINFVTADLATNRDALPQTNTFTRLELSLDLVFIEGLTDPHGTELEFARAPHEEAEKQASCDP